MQTVLIRLQERVGRGEVNSRPKWTCVLFVVLMLAGSINADWPQFRGYNSSGFGSGSPPIEFGPGVNELWKTELAAGHSSPCLFEDRIFLTTFHQDKSSVGVVCLDRSNGKVLWERLIQVESLEKGHPSFNPASSSPCCDAERIIAYFGSHGLICFNHDGQHLWEKRLPLTKSFGGNATSPIIAGDNVILYRGNYVDHFLLCLDKSTGEEEWCVPQQEQFTGEMACTACPIVANNQLICHSARSVQSFDIETGKRIWIVKCATTATSTPVIVENEVIVAAWNKMGEPDLRPPFPSFDEMISKNDQNDNQSIEKSEFPKVWIFHRPDGIEAAMNGAPISWKHANKNSDEKLERNEWKKTVEELEQFRSGYERHGLIAIPIDSQGFVSADQVRTLVTKGIPEVPSPVFDGTNVYLVKNGGLLTCINAMSGKKVYQTRTRGTGTHYASPVIADGRLYSSSGNGQISVLQLGKTPKILAFNEMPDSIYATPAISDGVIYVRTHSAIFAFGESK